MNTFYDYDMTFQRRKPIYGLRAHGKPLPNGGYCLVYEADEGVWVRKTNWLFKWGNGGVRYERYKSLDDALLAGIKWARRREREDRKEMENG